MAKYVVGQKVMHPLHGIGVVEKIEEKNILGKTSKFSVIHFTSDRLKIMVNLGQKTMIRSLVNKDELTRVFDVIKQDAADLPARSADRYNINMKKIKSADIFQMAEVIRDLTDLNRKKKLSRKEQTLLKQAKKIFCSEVGYVRKMTEEEVEALVESSVQIPVEVE